MFRPLAIVLPLLFALPASAAAQGLPAGPAPCPGNPNALGIARVMPIDPATLPPVGLKTYPQTLDLADHEVVLTFDDGPSARTTPRVLAALEHECVRATFFLIGRNAETARTIVRREIADGDLVAHHSWSHPAVTEAGLSEAAAHADIDAGFVADDKAAFGTAGPQPRVPVFRFPGFGDSPALLAWLAHRHIAVFGADLWASDWLEQTPEAELALLMARLDKVGGGIVLLHDIKQQTAAMLPALLDALKTRHYHVVALTLGSGPTPVRQAPAGWASETARTLAALRPHLHRHDASPIAAPAGAASTAPPRADTPVNAIGPSRQVPPGAGDTEEGVSPPAP